MHKFSLRLSLYYLIFIFAAVNLSGCTLIFQKGRKKDVEAINSLQNENARLQDELSELERAKAELESRLRNEINDDEVSVKMMEKGLVITFLSEVLFDSGKATLRDSATAKLDKVARILNTTVRDLDIGIEGHTDNVPIKYSGWKTNWELSSARALSVLHFLIEQNGVEPRRLSARGYGEYQPVASNDDPGGRQKNRRVEIVILPPTTKAPAVQTSENLK